MATKKLPGTCQICGLEKELTFEHVPPKKAFNDAPALIHLASVEQLSSLPPNTTPFHSEAIFYEKGFGSYTLCGECNNYTGGTYGKYYVAFARQIYESIESRKEVKGKFAQVSITFRPARVLKQIIVMFASIYANTGRVFGEDYPELKDILLNKNALWLPSSHSFYLYFLAGGSARFVTHALVVADQEPSLELLRIIQEKFQRGETISEFAFGFLGFVWARGADSRQVVDQTGLLLKIDSWIESDDEITSVLEVPLLEAFPPHLPLQYSRE